MRFMAIVAAVAVAAFAAGCDQNSNKTVKVKGKDGNVTITSNGEHMTVKSDDGKTSVEINTNGVANLKLPDFVPVYPGAQVQGSVTASAEGGGTFFFESKDGPDKVIAFYRAKAASAGLAEKMTMNNEGSQMFMASAGEDKKVLQVTVTKNETGSHAQVVWQVK